MKRCGEIVLALAVLSMLAAGLRAQETAPSKSAVPSADEIKTATKAFEDVYKADITAAKTPEQIAAVVTKIKTSVAGESNSAVKYVMLKRIESLQNTAGDIVGAVETVNEIAKSFQSTGYKLQAESAAAAAKLLKTNDQRVRLLLFTLTATDEAMAAEDFESAKSLSATAAAAVRMLGSIEMITEVAAIATNVRETEQALLDYMKVKTATDLKADDADANFKVGKYLCFFKTDWDKGLPSLAKGSNAQFKTAAESDLKGSASELKGTLTAAEKVKMGDQWWSAAGTQSKTAKFNIQARAAKWYESAFTAIENAAEKDRVLKKLSEYGEATAARKGAASQVVERVFVGKWSIPIATGRGVITLTTDHGATCDWRPATGTWEFTNRECVITWEDGWHDVFRFSATGFSKSGYGPGIDVNSVDKTAAATTKLK